MTEQVGVGRLDRPRGELDHALVVPGAEPSGSLDAGSPNSITAGMPRAAASLASSAAAEMEEVVVPGQAGDGRAALRAVTDEHRVDQMRR